MKPIKNYSDPAHRALAELTSGLSALHMEADPIPGATGYLAETDSWVRHAVEHFEEARQQMWEVRRIIDLRYHLLYHALQTLQDCPHHLAHKDELLQKIKAELFSSEP